MAAQDRITGQSMFVCLRFASAVTIFTPWKMDGTTHLEVFQRASSSSSGIVVFYYFVLLHSEDAVSHDNRQQ